MTTRFSLVAFLMNKSDAFGEFTNFVKCIQRERELSVMIIWSDNEDEFDNKKV